MKVIFFGININLMYIYYILLYSNYSRFSKTFCKDLMYPKRKKKLSLAEGHTWSKLFAYNSTCVFLCVINILFFILL